MATMAHAVGMGMHGRTEAAARTADARESVAKNLLLFFAAPLIGLAYVIAFPFVGVAALVRIALR